MNIGTPFLEFLWYLTPPSTSGGDNPLSIEVIVKLAKAFDVSLDYLLGEGMNANYDKEMVKRLDEVENLPPEEKQRIFHYMDLIIRDYKGK